MLARGRGAREDDRMTANYLSVELLEAGLEHIRQAPKDAGVLEMIVRRPEIDAREVLDEGILDCGVGLTGDNWRARGDESTPDGAANLDAQLTLMNARVAGLLAVTRERWALAGDQLFVDLDLSVENLPPGTRLAIGSAIIEVTAVPHTGCAKFRARFGPAALQFVNSPVGRELRLRGLNARIVISGRIRQGDLVARR
jgi:hypothetical protein